MNEFREPALLVPGRGPDRCQLALGVVRAADLLEDGPRLLVSAPLRQPARALGHGEQQPEQRMAGTASRPSIHRQP